MAGGAAHLGDDAQHIGPVHSGSVRGQQFLRGHNHRPLQAVKAARGRPLQNAQQAQLHVGEVCRALADPCVRRAAQHGAVVFIHLLYRPLRRPLLALDAREDLLIHHFIVQDIHVRLEDGGLVGLQPGAHAAQFRVGSLFGSLIQGPLFLHAAAVCRARRRGHKRFVAINWPGSHAARDACAIVDHVTPPCAPAYSLLDISYI